MPPTTDPTTRASANLAEARPSPGRPLAIAIALSAVVTLSTLLPYVVHSRHPLPGRVYSGLEYNIADQLTYLMWVNQVRLGHNSVANLYVTEATDRFAPSPVWWLMGLVGRVSSWSSATIYQGGRVLFAFAYLVLLFGLARRFAGEGLPGDLAWGLCALGGGLAWVGWLLRPVMPLAGAWLPADTWMPELWSYGSILVFPHWSASLLLVAGTVLCLRRGWAEGRARWPVAAGLLLGLLAVVHTYTAVPLAAVIAVHAVVWRLAAGTWRPVLRTNALALVVTVPFVAYQYAQVAMHESLHRWFGVLAISSPPWLSYVLGFGLIVPLAIYGGVLAFRHVAAQRKHTPVGDDGRLGTLSTVFLLVWVLVTIAFLFSALSFERRCVEGLHIPLCLLAVTAFVALVRRWAPDRPRSVAVGTALLVLACAPTNVCRMYATLISRGGYVDAGLVAAERAAYERFGEGARVLTGPEFGGWIGSQGRLRAWMGHPEYTYDWVQRQRILRRFFSPQTGSRDRLALFRQTGCDVVAASPQDAAVLLREPQSWRGIFQQGDVALLVPAGG